MTTFPDIIFRRRIANKIEYVINTSFCLPSLYAITFGKIRDIFFNNVIFLVTLLMGELIGI